MTAPTTERMLPLYQGMMTSFFDHRAADVVRSEGARTRQNQPRYLSDTDKTDPTRLAQPQYWIRESLIEPELPAWLLGFSDITSATNERTVVPAAVPKVGVGNTVSLAIGKTSSASRACLLACLGSFVVDYLARQSVGGLHLNFYLVKQFAVLPPSSYVERAAWALDSTTEQWLVPRVAELVATADDMTVFADEANVEGAPFTWDPARREAIRAELDAAFFHLYGVARDDVDYILETFPIVRRKDVEAHGEYRTKRLILEVFDAMQAAIDTGTKYRTDLDPPPGRPRRSDQETSR